MRETSNPRMPCCGTNFLSMCVLSYLCVLVFAGYTWAQPTPPDPQPPNNQEPSAKAEPAPKVKPAPKLKPVADAKPARKAHPKAKSQTNKRVNPRGTKRRGKGSIKLKMNPDAKWACDQKMVTLPPVWRGDKKLTYNFNIRNEGTADLQIKAKGG